MALTRLPQCLLKEMFACLGPDFARLRAACAIARRSSEDSDLESEILKWICVNSSQLDDPNAFNIHCLEFLGRIPMRCSICKVRSVRKQMYRYKNRRRDEGVRVGVKYFCCYCVFQETQYFLQGHSGHFSMAGLANRERTHIIIQILCRVRMPHRGFLGECLAAVRARCYGARALPE